MPLSPGQTTLGAIRLSAQQRADMVNSQFLSAVEWNANINASYQELYGLIVTSYGEDYEFATPYTFQVDGTNEQFALPSDTFKVLGVDWVQTPGNTDGNVTLKRFNFAERNRLSPILYPALGGVIVPRYRLAGSTIWFKPRPQGGQSFTVYYAPRLSLLASDTDVVDGVNGWEEYIVVDAAIKALQKEESDVSLLMAQKAALLKRIEEEASNRDAGSPARVADVRPRGASSFDWPDEFWG